MNVSEKGPGTTARRDREIAKVIEANWQAEMTGYFTYQTFAEREHDASSRATLEGLARAEKEHAAKWAGRLSQLGVPLPQYLGSLSGEADTLIARFGSTIMALRQLEIEEGRDIAKYGRQLRELNDPESVAILAEVIHDEQIHHRKLRELTSAMGPLPVLSPEEAQNALDGLLSRRDTGRSQAGGWIGDAIYGINDGLGAIFGIVSGVSGATVGNQKFVLIAGLAGMIASALSMGSGAYLAAKSEREIFEAEFHREREAVELNPAEAREILSLSYQIGGLSAEDADRFVDHIAQDKDRLVAALARERLHTSEDGLKKPVTSALSGAASTALGAFIPIVPFFFASGYTAVILAAAVSLVAHFAVGAAKSLITVRSWWSSGLEMTFVGAVEGAVTYAVGLGLGHLGG